MRNVMMVMAMMCWCLGCGSGLKVVIVQPLDESDTLASKAVILSLANQPQAEEVKTPDAVACKCGGTGRSGDGLGPCACPDGCSCKVNRAEPVVEEEPVPEPVDAEEPEFIEEPVTATADDTDMSELLVRLTDVSEELAQNQTGFSDRLDSFEERLKAIEQPVVKQVDLFETSAAETKVIVNQLFVFTKMDGSCPPCTRFDDIEVPLLIDAGWSVGRDETYRIVLVDVAGELSESMQDRFTPYAKFGTPYFAYFKAGKFQKGYAGYTTSKKISDDFNAMINQKVSAARLQPVTVQSRLPVMRTQWGTIDMETYARNCNCPMCAGIRAIQGQLRQSQSRTMVVPAHQEPTPDVVIDKMLTGMELTSNDVLADLGCGDGRILVAAYRKYRCKCVGVEIDPGTANEARRRVKDAGLDGQIVIITGDAREFVPERYGVTAITAYLYPELLQQLVPVFKRAKVVATPYHKVPGMPMTESDGVWMADTRKAVKLQPSSQMTVPSFGAYYRIKPRTKILNSNSL
jgi:hypothetical protein